MLYDVLPMMAKGKTFHCTYSHCSSLLFDIGDVDCLAPTGLACLSIPKDILLKQGCMDGVFFLFFKMEE